MKKQIMLIMISILAVFALAACGQEEVKNKEIDSVTASPAPGQDQDQGAGKAEEEVKTELTITHDLGETVVPVNPEKVVVFDYGVLDSLDKLGVEVTGVPQGGTIPPYLSKYADAKYENVGTLKEADFEKISEIDPDLIIISGRMSESYDELSKLGPTIFLGVDTSKYMESYKENAETLGKIFSKEDQVKEEIAAVEASIEALNKKVAESGKNALIILANDGNISAYGAGSRFGIIHDVMGFTPVDANIDVSTHGMPISFEYIVEKDPDYLFVVDRGAVVAGGESSAKQLVENELTMNIKAMKEGNVYYLDPNYWYLSGGGLISVAEMVKEIEQAFE